MEQMLLQILDEIKGTNERIDRLESKIDAVETGLTQRIDAVETRLGERIDTLETELIAIESRLTQRIDVIRDVPGHNLEQESRINELFVKVEAIETDVRLVKKLITN